MIPSAELHQHRREVQLTLERADAAIALSANQGFPVALAMGTLLRGWALAAQGQGEEGIIQIRRGITTLQTVRTEVQGPFCFALLAEAYGKVGQIEEGLTALDEALTMVNKNGEHWWEAELYRLKGELSLQSEVRSPKSREEKQKSKGKGQKSKVPNTQPLTPSTQTEMEREAEECFRKAIAIARQQQAKSLELRAVMSLSRLWQQQGKPKDAHLMLSEIYGWFTEGFDTKDLQEAKALLKDLS